MKLCILSGGGNRRFGGTYCQEQRKTFLLYERRKSASTNTDKWHYVIFQGNTHYLPQCTDLYTSHTFTLRLFTYDITALSGPGLHHCRNFTITLRHSTVGRTPLDEWSALRRDIYLKAHNTHEGQSWPRRDSNTQSHKRAATDSRLRPHGHWNWPPKRMKTGSSIIPRMQSFSKIYNL